MQHKKAQISLFLIIGFVVLILGAFLFFLRENTNDTSTLKVYDDNDEDIKKAAIERCIKEYGENGLYLVGLGGGHIEDSKYSYEYESLNTSYLYYLGEITSPSISDIQHGLSAYMDENLPYCEKLKEFHDLETIGVPKTETLILNDKVRYVVDWQVQFRNYDSTQDISDYVVDIPLNFVKYYDAAVSIINMTLNDPEYIDHIFLLSQFMNISYMIDDETVLYLINDIDPPENNLEYSYLFAVKV